MGHLPHFHLQVLWAIFFPMPPLLAGPILAEPTLHPALIVAEVGNCGFLLLLVLANPIDLIFSVGPSAVASGVGQFCGVSPLAVAVVMVKFLSVRH